MKIVCDACSAKYSIADEKVRGKVFKIRCKKCSNIIVVRGSVNESAEPAAPQYDHKETKVFDYQKSGEGAADASDGAVWHLVIDQEQIGPMTVEEVEERFRRGEVDSDGYVWREGFGDWERLGDVDVFAALASGQRADDGGMGGLFGSGNLDDGRTVQNDPADLFAARGAGDDAAVGADLFAGTGLSSDGGDTDALFAGDGMAGSAVSVKPASSTLTAQRNENSVLFSLNNLAALASDAPRSSSSSTSTSLSASSSSTSLASGSSVGSGPPQSEGSGLIDIRSMAQVYLGESKQAPRPVGSVDDLPVFSQTSFEAASPVLLPNVQPAVNNRLLFALVGLIGVLVIAAGVLVIIVLKGGGDDGPRVAAIDPEAPVAAPAASPTPAAAPSADPAAPAAAPAAAGDPAAPAAGATPPDPAAAPTPAAAPADDDDDDDKSRSGDRRGRDRDRDRDRDRRTSRAERDKPERSKPEPAPAPAPDPTASSGCDEVTCLVEPDKPCCQKGRRSGSSGSRSAAVDPNLPERPSRGDVSSGIGAVKGSVSACGSRAPGGGKVTVKIKISPSGTVSSASASGGSSSLNGCVESAVRRAKFPKSQLGASVNYPFIF